MEKVYYSKNSKTFIKKLEVLYNNQNQEDKYFFGEINPQYFYEGILIVDENRPVAVVIISKMGKSFYSVQVLVDKDHRRMGYAENLFNELINYIDIPDNSFIYYNYYPNNYRSGGLSKKLGFDKYLIRSRQTLKKLKIINKNK